MLLANHPVALSKAGMTALPMPIQARKAFKWANAVAVASSGNQAMKKQPRQLGPVFAASNIRGMVTLRRGIQGIGGAQGTHCTGQGEGRRRRGETQSARLRQ